MFMICDGITPVDVNCNVRVCWFVVTYIVQYPVAAATIILVQAKSNVVWSINTMIVLNNFIYI